MNAVRRYLCTVLCMGLYVGLLCVPLCLPTPAAALEVNSANEAELDSMRGLGPDSTARILKARETGPFAHWTDLMQRVKGIKQGTAQKLSAQGLTVNGQSFTGGANKPASSSLLNPAAGPGPGPAPTPAPTPAQ